jgi:hypothetical protein
VTVRLIESAEAIAELSLGSVLRSHNGVAVLNQDGWIVSGYIYPRTHEDVEEYIGAYPVELLYDGAEPDVPRRDGLIDTMFLARNIINQLGDAWAEAIPSEQWVPVRQATNDVMDGWVSQLIREAVAAAWAEGYTVAHNGDRGWPDDRPWPADRARELAEWNPYRDERKLCATCGGSGVCGSAPDAYYDCPDCSGVVVDLDDTRDDRVEP